MGRQHREPRWLGGGRRWHDGEPAQRAAHEGADLVGQRHRLRGAHAAHARPQQGQAAAAGQRSGGPMFLALVISNQTSSMEDFSKRQ